MKLVYFLLYKKVLNIENLTYIFLKIIIINYKLLNKIILDRDKLFNFKF